MARALARRAGLVVALAGAFTVVALAVGGTAIGRMQGGSNQFEDPSSESARAWDRLADAAGELPDPGVVAVVDGDPDVVAARLREDDAVARVGVQDDVVLAWFTSDDERADGATKRLLAELGGDPSVVLGGPAVAGRQVADTVESDLKRAELIAFPLVFLLSLWVFRGVVAALLPPLVGLASIATTLLGLRLVVELTDLSVFAVNLVTGLGLGLAIDYSLFMVSRYREELAIGGHTVETLRRTLATAGRTVLFSSLTVAAAMASLLVFPQRFLVSMAIGGTLVALASGAIALLALPALLHLLGPRVNALAPERWRQPPSRGRWAALAAAVMRRPGTVAFSSGGLLVALALPALGVAFTGIDAKTLPSEASAYRVAVLLEERGLRASSSPLNVVLDREPAPELVARLGALPGAAGATPAVEVAPRTWRVDVLPRAPSLDPATQRLVREVRAAVPDGTVAGGAAAFADQQSSLRAHIPWALAILCVTTFVILFALTGSVVLPLKALLMNALTIGAAFGILVIVFEWGLGEQGLESTQPILLCATAFGLSTDYAVFLLSRIIEARERGLDDRAAVAEGLERTGRIVTAAALLFCIAIGAFATSELVFVQQLGLGTAAAVALDATIVRAFLVPSLMALLGRWNWWAPAPLARLHARLRIGTLV
jgi:RND superfamily putative drug exporter